MNKTTDNYYVFQNTINTQEVDVSAQQWNSWTPQQQFNFLKSIGQIDKNTQFQLNPDGTWGTITQQTPTTSTSTVLARYTDSNGGVNLAQALANGVRTDYLLQNGFTQTQINQALEYNQVTTVLKPYQSANGYNLQQALTDKKVTDQQLVDVGFSPSDVNKAETNIALSAILNNPKNGIVDAKGNADLGKAIANGNLTTDDLIGLGFSQPAVYANAVLVNTDRKSVV